MRQMFIIAVLGALIVLFALGTMFGVDMSPQNILEVLGSLAA